MGIPFKDLWPVFKVMVIHPDNEEIVIDKDSVVSVEIVQNHGYSLDRLKLTLLSSKMMAFGFRNHRYGNYWKSDYRYAWISVELGYPGNLKVMGAFAIEKVTWSGGAGVNNICVIEGINTNLNSQFHSDRDRIYSKKDILNAKNLIDKVIENGKLELKYEKGLNPETHLLHQYESDYNFLKRIGSEQFAFIQLGSDYKVNIKGPPPEKTETKGKESNIVYDSSSVYFLDSPGGEDIDVPLEDIITWNYFYDNNNDYNTITAKWHDQKSGVTEYIVWSVEGNKKIKDSKEVKEKGTSECSQNENKSIDDRFKLPNSGGDINLTLPEIYGSEFGAQQAAKNARFSLKMGLEWLEMTVVGNPKIKPPCFLVMKDFGKEQFEVKNLKTVKEEKKEKEEKEEKGKPQKLEKFRLRTVTHIFDENGYVSKIEAMPEYEDAPLKSEKQ